jgi:hypothetical protein
LIYKSGFAVLASTDGLDVAATGFAASLLTLPESFPLVGALLPEVPVPAF